MDIIYPKKTINLYQEGTTPYLEICPYRLKNADRAELAKPGSTSAEKMGYNLILPIPVEGISTEESHDWQEESDIAGDLISALGATYLEKASKTNAIENIKWLESMNEAGAVNDLTSLLYKLSAMRNFSFSWNLIPESKFDEISISNIIYVLRTFGYGSSTAVSDYLKNSTNPVITTAIGAITTGAQLLRLEGDPIDAIAKSNNIFVLNPPVWKITAYGIKDKENKQQILFQSSWCALTNVKVTKLGGDKAFTLFNDGGIVQQRLDISFKELYRHTIETITL